MGGAFAFRILSGHVVEIDRSPGEADRRPTRNPGAHSRSPAATTRLRPARLAR
jgi:hypothetical protein